jgi:hypothetical protein
MNFEFNVNVNFNLLFKIGALFLYFFGLYHIGCIPNGGIAAALVFFVFSISIRNGYEEFALLPDAIQILLHWSIAGYGAYCLFA